METEDLTRPVVNHWLTQALTVTFDDGPHSVAENKSARLNGLTPAQLYWWLEHDKVEKAEDLSTKCKVEGCVSHLQLNVAVSDDELMQLVEQKSVSLAELYRKGKKRGLIQPSAQGYA